MMGYKGVINNHVFLASVNREMVFGHSKKKKIQYLYSGYAG